MESIMMDWKESERLENRKNEFLDVLKVSREEPDCRAAWECFAATGKIGDYLKFLESKTAAKVASEEETQRRTSGEREADSFF